MIKPIVTNKEQLAVPSKRADEESIISMVVTDLLDTAKHHAKSKVGCLGLAANQIGFLHRIIVVNKGGVWVPMINPVIDKVEGCKSSLVGEGCLSRPGVNKKIRRDKIIIVRYWDENEDLVEEIVKNFDARVIQHEVDHLNGKFI